jgi:hypothetical protein
MEVHQVGIAERAKSLAEIEATFGTPDTIDRQSSGRSSTPSDVASVGIAGGRRAMRGCAELPGRYCGYDVAPYQGTGGCGPDRSCARGEVCPVDSATGCSERLLETSAEDLAGKAPAGAKALSALTLAARLKPCPPENLSRVPRPSKFPRVRDTADCRSFPRAFPEYSLRMLYSIVRRSLRSLALHPCESFLRASHQLDSCRNVKSWRQGSWVS